MNAIQICFRNWDNSGDKIPLHGRLKSRDPRIFYPFHHQNLLRQDYLNWEHYAKVEEGASPGTWFHWRGFNPYGFREQCAALVMQGKQ